MAAGDVFVFDEAKLALLDGTHDLDTHAFKVGLVTNAVVPAVSDATPAFGDYTEVTAGGGYTAGGTALTVALTEVGGTVTYDFTNNPVWTQNAGSPTDARWGIIYNNTNAGKEAIGYLDLGAVVDLTAGDLTITWNASGFFTLA